MNRSLLYPRATTTRRLIGLDGMWRFSFDPESKGVEAGWALDLPSSLSMPVPASFCDLFTDKASREYCGDFWYETSFFVPAEWSGWDIVLRFGSVTHRARVFVNGVEVAQHEGGFLPFDATVTNIVRYNQFNKLSVLANNELSETMLPAGTTRTLADGRKVAAPYFDFYNYAGIHRPVWLMALPKERVLDYSTRYRLTETGAEIDYTVSTNGPHPVTVELYAMMSAAQHSSTAARMRMAQLRRMEGDGLIYLESAGRGKDVCLTPEGEALLRTSYMATHTEALLDEAMDIMADVLVKDHA